MSEPSDPELEQPSPPPATSRPRRPVSREAGPAISTSAAMRARDVSRPSA